MATIDDKYLQHYKYLNVDKNESYKKWEPVIKRIIFTDSVNIITELSVIIEKYHTLLELKYNYYSPFSIDESNELYTSEKVLKIMANEVNKQLIHGTKRIEYEYYNILNNKKGLMLEGNIMVEDGNYINFDKSIIENIIIKKIQEKIIWILSPTIRNREQKLKRILKNE